MYGWAFIPPEYPFDFNIKLATYHCVSIFSSWRSTHAGSVEKSNISFLQDLALGIWGNTCVDVSIWPKGGLAQLLGNNTWWHILIQYSSLIHLSKRYRKMSNSSKILLTVGVDRPSDMLFVTGSSQAGDIAQVAGDLLFWWKSLFGHLV